MSMCSVLKEFLSVFVPDTEGKTKPTQDEKVLPRPPKMKSMHVDSSIRNRYARTVVTSKYFNEDQLHAQEATFSIVLPDTAFIAGFVMEIKGKKYEAYVKEKEEAKQEYDAAVSRGRAAAHVAVSARDSNKFTVSANVEPHSDVTFILTYEELLVRKHSKYDIVINLHPTQFIDDLQVDVHINETRPILNVETPALKSGNVITTEVTRNEYATISKDEDNVVHVNFKPTIDQQMKMAKAMEASEKKDNQSIELTDKGKINSISGQFIVQYDVERDPLGGEVLVNDGYFVHFFAPTDLKPIPKHVIFVLDVSGSMGGIKLIQLKEAMSVILDELNPKDHFNIVKFSNRICVLNPRFTWDEIEIPTESNLPNSFEVSDKNIRSVKNVLRYMQAEGSTNIYDALIVGLRITSKGILHLQDNDNQHKPQPIIVFLTDGLPNVCESNPDKIIEMVGYRNDSYNKSAIFALAFGFNADAKFLKELAIQNSGFARHIYEAADASIQLQDFYKQISSPLLTNVKFNYTEEIKQDLTRYNFDILFKGSEFVVAGKTDELVDDFVFVEAFTLDGVNRYYPTITRDHNKIKENRCKLISCENKETHIVAYGSLERLWAYMTIKQLLDKKYEKKCEDSNNQSEKDQTQNESELSEKQALKLALKYSFVTPVTSLVVVKPDVPAVAENVKAIQDLATDDITPHAPCLKKKITKRKAKREYPSIISTIETDDQEYIVKLNNVQITCDVKNHVAYIAEARTYQNFSANAEEISYNIILPEEAVVTQFYLKGAEMFKGIGQNENEAQNQYQTAKANNLDAALVNLQDLNKTTVNVHIMPGNAVTLTLHYQIYLQNKNNKYDLIMNLNIEKYIDNVAVIVTISEKQAVIKNILPHFKYQDKIFENKYATINKPDDNFATIEFQASEKLQEEIAKALNTTDNKLSCQFFVEYEIEPNSSAFQGSQSNAATALLFPYLIAYKA